MDNSNLAAQVLRSQAMAGMREMMKRMAWEVFDEEIRPLLEKMVREAVAEAMQPQVITVGFEGEEVTGRVDAEWVVLPEPAPPVDPDPALRSPADAEPLEKKRRRWWR
ncbi:MAG: hypothetical protein WC683_09630 [bacterium]